MQKQHSRPRRILWQGWNPGFLNVRFVWWFFFFFFLLTEAKENKFQGRAQKEGINSKTQLPPLYAPQMLSMLWGGTVLWLNLQSCKSLGLTKANFKPPLLISVIGRVISRRSYFYLIEGANTALLSATSLARINQSLLITCLRTPFWLALPCWLRRCITSAQLNNMPAVDLCCSRLDNSCLTAAPKPCLQNLYGSQATHLHKGSK